MKKLIGAVLALFLVLGALLPVYADDGDKVYRTLMYNDRKSEYVNFEVEFVFNDSWFGLPATEYNHSLAKALAVLCGAAYVDVRADNIVSTLVDMGFDSESMISDYPAPTADNNDTVGYVIAKKTVGDKDIIAVIIKGTSEDAEWYSNFNIGRNSDTHEGFLTASEKVWESLEEITSDSSGNVGFIVTGHSRGAAVANIIASKIIDSGYADKDNVYAYTFASPLVSTNASYEGYESIFNIVASVDFVTRLPVSGWGYKRYGKDLFIPSKSFSDPMEYEDMLKEVSEMYASYTKKAYVPYEGSVASDNLGRYLFTKTDKKNDYYYEKLQKNENEKATLDDYFNVIASSLVDSEDMSQSLKLFEYDMEFAPVNEFFVNNHLMADRVFSAHSMSSYFSWLSVCEEDDLSEKADFIRLRFSQNADIEVYDNDGNLSAEVSGGIITKNDIAVNLLSGNTYIDIPSGGYTVKISSSEDIILNISAEKLITSETEIPAWAKDYYGISITPDDSLVITVGETADMTINGETIIPTYDQKSDIPVYTVKTEAVGNGICYGGGKFRKGECVTLTAISSMMEHFNGWYDGETLLSEEASYTFTVDDYTHIYAKFTENLFITADVNGDGMVNSDDLSYILAFYGTDDAAGDIDKNGIVNASDLSMVLSDFGKSL